MSAESNAAVARRILEEGFNEGDLEVFDEVCAPDVVSHDPAEEADVRGVEAHKERVRSYREAMSDFHVTLEDLIASEDKVVTRWSVSGTNDGQLMGMPPTNRRVNITGISIDRFDESGRIAETWDEWDNAGFMSQLGMSEEAVAETT